MSRALAVRIAGARTSIDGRPVLDGVALDIADGEFVALLGDSRRSTGALVQALLGVEQLDEGDLLVPLRRAAMFGESRLSRTTRVLTNAVAGERGVRTRTQAWLDALAEVGLTHRARANPSTLSREEAHRMALARAFLGGPDLLLLDEPFAALDPSARPLLQGLLADLHRRHRPTVLLVTEDIDEAILLADRIVVLTAGRVEIDLPSEDAATFCRADPTFLDPTTPMPMRRDASAAA